MAQPEPITACVNKRFYSMDEYTIIVTKKHAPTLSEGVSFYFNPEFSMRLLNAEALTLSVMFKLSHPS